MTDVLPLEREAAIAQEQDYLFHAGRPDPHTAWNRAACLEADPEIFFPISPRDLRGREQARAYCASCAVRTDCLQLALADPGIVGIWGGTDEEDRRRLRGRSSRPRLVVVPDSVADLL